MVEAVTVAGVVGKRRKAVTAEMMVVVHYVEVQASSPYPWKKLLQMHAERPNPFLRSIV